MAASARLARAAALLLVAVGPACTQAGDFGRVKRSAWNDGVIATGAVGAGLREEPVSSFPFTDDEAELRGRAWRFLVPAHGRATLDRLLAELVATRILPAAAAQPDPADYLHALLGGEVRSPASRYRRLGEDISADTRLIAPFAAIAARVLRADGTRLQLLAHLAQPSAAEIANAEDRVAENRCLVAWVAAASRFRIESYGFALDRLVLAAPGLDAVAVERSLGRLGAERALLDRLGVRPLAAASCLGPAVEEVAPLAPRGPPAPVAKG